jgi:hypothetical protein
MPRTRRSGLAPGEDDEDREGAHGADKHDLADAVIGDEPFAQRVIGGEEEDPRR